MTPKPKQAHLTTLDFALLRGVIEEMPLGVATTRGGDIVYANAALERMWGTKPGGLDGRPVEALLGAETTQRVRVALEKDRLFDDRIRARSLDGRDFIAELHVERYKASAGVGGFLLVRDVTVEASALGRLVDQLGGAMFRLNVEQRRIEHVTPSIAQLTGFDARACMDDIGVLVELVDPAERERLRAIYQRLVRGDVRTATAELRLMRADGLIELLRVEATGRRDVDGSVRHIEGVVMRVGRTPVKSASTLLGMIVPSASKSSNPPPPSSAETRSSPSRRPPPPPPSTAAQPSANRALVELSQDLMGQVTELMSGATSDAGALDTLFDAVRQALPDPTADLFAERLDSMVSSVAIANSLCRRVRRALAGRVSRAAFVDVLENVRTALAPLIGEHSVVIGAGNAGGVFLRGPLDALVLVLVQLGLRAFRLGGSGLLRIEAKRRRPGVNAPSEVLIDIIGERPVENEVNAVYDTESGCLPATPRPADADRTSELASVLLASASGSIATDEWTMHAARTTVVLREDAP